MIVEVPPPSYESLFGEFRKADTPSGYWNVVRKAAGIFAGSGNLAASNALSLIYSVCLVLAAGTVGVISCVPVAMIVIGSLHLHDCPAEGYIPIYLIVGGVFGLVKSLLNLGYRFKHQRHGVTESNSEEMATQNPLDGLLGCFLLAWFIAGTKK